MIILFHNGVKPFKYIEINTNKEFICKEKTIQKALFNLSNIYSNQLIIWCKEELKTLINYKKIENIFHHKLIFASYGNCDVSNKIGYVDQHCFINVKKDITYPTWLMSGDIGGAYSCVIQQSKEIVDIKQSFSLYLSSFAKFSMPKGLLCYSEPSLLLKENNNFFINKKENNTILYRFVKKHYKIQWIFILFINQLINNKEFPLIPLIKILFVKRKKNISLDFSHVNVKSKNGVNKEESFKVDVLIPTLGRKKYLYDVLLDLSHQTLLPQKIIIVEQNGDKKSESELDYLSENWPFKIDHTFTHQLGACNARNIALSKITGNWVFFADDDVRFNKNLLKDAYDSIQKIGLTSFTFSCLQKNENELKEYFHQWNGFGTNASIVKSEFLVNCSFKSEHEFGYGEDGDFGMQLKNLGCDNVYLPSIKMLHLKAPIGGFRYRFKPIWGKEKIKPKPSPTVMAFKLKHLTKEQLRGYKTLLFIKFYKKQSIKNPLAYLRSFNKRWDVSTKWAKQMMEDEV